MGVIFGRYSTGGWPKLSAVQLVSRCLFFSTVDFDIKTWSVRQVTIKYSKTHEILMRAGAATCRKGNALAENILPLSVSIYWVNIKNISLLHVFQGDNTLEMSCCLPNTIASHWRNGSRRMSRLFPMRWISLQAPHIVPGII